MLVAREYTEQRYLPHGAPRPGFTGSGLPTDRRFTGQRAEATLGFYDFNARQYDPALGRFLQADSIVPQPGNPQSLNRYAYTLNNPLRYTDPSGHIPEVFYNEELGYYVVKLDMQIYGSGASKELAQEWQEYLNKKWNTDSPQYNNRPVIFEIAVEHKNPEFGILGKLLNWLGFEGFASPKSGDVPNLICVIPEKTQFDRATVHPYLGSGKDYDGGIWFADMGNPQVFHESAHLFGIYDDRYDPVTERPLPGYYGYISADATGQNVGKPHSQEVREIIELAVDRGQFAK